MPKLSAILTCLLIAASALVGDPLPARAQNDERPVWLAQYPLSPMHPVVSEGWAPMAEAVADELNLELRLIGPRLGTVEALEALTRGSHQMGVVALASYPRDFPYWALLGELFLVGSESLAAAAAITELVMLDCTECQSNLIKRKLVFLGTYGAAPYVMVAPAPLARPNSLEQQIVASPGSLWDRLLQSLGARPEPSGPESRGALVAGEVTALIDIPSALAVPPLNQRALAVTQLPLGGYRGAGPFMINRNAWREISPDVRRRLMTSAAAGLVRITNAYHRSANRQLAAARARGVTVTEGELLLADRIRRFAAADQSRVAASALERFGIADADVFLARLKALYDKYVILTGPHASEQETIALLTSEIFDRLDPETYGLR